MENKNSLTVVLNQGHVGGRKKVPHGFLLKMRIRILPILRNGVVVCSRDCFGGRRCRNTDGVRGSRNFPSRAGNGFGCEGGVPQFSGCRRTDRLLSGGGSCRVGTPCVGCRIVFLSNTEAPVRRGEWSCNDKRWWNKHINTSFLRSCKTSLEWLRHIPVGGPESPETFLRYLSPCGVNGRIRNPAVCGLSGNWCCGVCPGIIVFLLVAIPTGDWGRGLRWEVIWQLGRWCWQAWLASNPVLGWAEERSPQPEYRFALRLQGKTKHSWKDLGALAVREVPFLGDGSCVRRDSRGGPCLLLSLEKTLPVYHETSFILFLLCGCSPGRMGWSLIIWKALNFRVDGCRSLRARGSSSFSTSGAPERGDLRTQNPMDRDADDGPISRHVDCGVETSQGATSPFRSQLAETPLPSRLIPAMTDHGRSSLGEEQSEVLPQAESVLSPHLCEDDTASKDQVV